MEQAPAWFTSFANDIRNYMQNTQTALQDMRETNNKTHTAIQDLTTRIIALETAFNAKTAVLEVKINANEERITAQSRIQLLKDTCEAYFWYPYASRSQQRIISNKS